MKKLLYLTLLLTFLVVSCEDPTDLEDKKKITDKTFDIEFKEVLNTNSRFQNKLEARATFVVKSKSEESDLFRNHLYDITLPPTPILPDIDYSTKMLLCIVYPMQSSGSNKLTVTDVKMNEGIIEVSSELFVPGIGTDDIGYPVVFVEIDKYDSEVNFLATNEVFGATNSDNIIGKTWKLKYTKNPDGSTTDPEFYMDEDSQWQRVVLDPFTINFNENNTANGKSNCNIWNGKYSINGDVIEFTELSSTEAACAYSDKFYFLLYNSNKITYTTDSVYIQSELHNEEYTMVFYYFNPQIENEILKSAWKLESWSEDGGLTYQGGYDENGTFVDFVEHDWTLKFNNGTVDINARCESFETNYTLDLSNSTIAFNKITSNGSDCSFNDEYIKAINESSSYELLIGALDRLILYDSQKKIVLRFVQDYSVHSMVLASNRKYILESVATINKSLSLSNITNVEDNNIIFETKNNFNFVGPSYCNNYYGNFIAYNNIGETSMEFQANLVACSNQQLENNYFNCLNSVTNFKWEDEKLILYHLEEGKEFNYLVYKVKN